MNKDYCRENRERSTKSEFCKKNYSENPYSRDNNLIFF